MTTTRVLCALLVVSAPFGVWQYAGTARENAAIRRSNEEHIAFEKQRSKMLLEQDRREAEKMELRKANMLKCEQSGGVPAMGWENGLGFVCIDASAVKAIAGRKW